MTGSVELLKSMPLVGRAPGVLVALAGALKSLVANHPTMQH
ncbi:hypothetical protein [Rhodococcus sp. WS3]|nr:hypothetical protein [Rhodococcus sp. WS3]